MPFLIDRVRDALAGEYVVEHELASGGMGVVFKARSIWYVALIHWTVGMSMEWFMLARPG